MPRSAPRCLCGPQVGVRFFCERIRKKNAPHFLAYWAPRHRQRIGNALKRFQMTFYILIRYLTENFQSRKNFKIEEISSWNLVVEGIQTQVYLEWFRMRLNAYTRSQGDPVLPFRSLSLLSAPPIAKSGGAFFCERCVFFCEFVRKKIFDFFQIPTERNITKIAQST